MWEEQPGGRTPAAAATKLDRALEELLVGEEGTALGLGGAELDEFVEDARQLVGNYFVLEDPNTVRVIGTELRLQVDLGPASAADTTGGTVLTGDAPLTNTGGRLRLRGIIDRLELDQDGELVVTDYKTGRAPGQSQEQTRLGGVHFYAFLCEQLLGRRPARVQLFQLREPLAISTTPSDQSIAGLERQAVAIWAAVKRACLQEDFRPKPGRLCDWCGYHAYCPAMGGDLPISHTTTTADGVGAGGQGHLPLFQLGLATAG
jgi:putative RecB family exonuclease